MSGNGDPISKAMPNLEDLQQWTWVAGRLQQIWMEHFLALAQDGDLATQSQSAVEDMMNAMTKITDMPTKMKFSLPEFDPTAFDPTQIMGALGASTGGDIWSKGMAAWNDMISGKMPSMNFAGDGQSASGKKDRRFKDGDWYDNPVFAMIRQSYQQISDQLLGWSDQVDGLDVDQKKQLRFAMQNLLDAASPTNNIFTNPQVLKKTVESKGENLLKGLEHMLADLRRGQLTHTDPNAFELGRNIAVTPGKVIKETPLYQLIHYAPTTKDVLETPLIIFPPWINRFYILDLNTEKSFVKWAVDQGISLFIVSWKSADESMADVIWDDYIVDGQIDAIDTVRELLDVPSVHTIGYCVAGTTLATTLALLAERGEADKVASATFFTAQVDFEEAGDLKLMTSDQHLEMVKGLSKPGYLDGRYMAATFNMLRGNDLIWNYVVNNYLLGQDYVAFDLLHWNGDTTNLPHKWHIQYLTDLYRDNKLVQPGAITIDGTPIDLSKIETPCYIQAGKEDHIAPASSVWKLTEHLSGPYKFLLAGSGHIAGVVNPPHAKKYQYWTNNDFAGSLDEFIAGAKETPGSWWPHWVKWLDAQNPTRIKTTGARKPGNGKLKALDDAPGSYVKSR